MTGQAPHFIQSGADPAVIGEGPNDLACRCGTILVKGFLPENLLAIDLLCGACGEITTTPGLQDLERPPYAVYVAERRTEPLEKAAEVGQRTALISQEEMARLRSVYEPRRPAPDPIVMDAATLDAVAADYDRITGGALEAHLAAVSRTGEQSAAGFHAFPMAWALQFLRARIGNPAWACGQDDASGVATGIVAGMRHFQLCWSHHPRFAAMEATIAADGLSLHTLARFAAAKGLADSGNRIGFPAASADGSPFIRDFHLAIGPLERQVVIVEPFEQFSWPSGRTAEPVPLFNAVVERLEASRGRINPRHPGILILSVGGVRSEFDELIINVMQAVLHKFGRRFRGLTGLGAILPKFLPTDRANAVLFGYGFSPLPNRHHGTGAIMRANPMEIASGYAAPAVISQ